MTIFLSVLGLGDLALSCGPAMVLEAYKTRSIETLRQHFGGEEVPNILEDYLYNPLLETWLERKAGLPPGDSSHWRSILNEIRSENDTCMWFALQLHIMLLNMT